MISTIDCEAGCCLRECDEKSRETIHVNESWC
jgi:hypothetical protein